MKNFNKLLCGLLLIFSFAVNTVTVYAAAITTRIDNIDYIVWSITSHGGENKFTFIVEGKEKNTQNVISICGVDSNAIRFVKDIINDKKYALIKSEKRKWELTTNKNIVLLLEIHISDDNDIEIEKAPTYRHRSGRSSHEDTDFNQILE